MTFIRFWLTAFQGVVADMYISAFPGVDAAQLMVNECCKCVGCQTSCLWYHRKPSFACHSQRWPWEGIF